MTEFEISEGLEFRRVLFCFQAEDGIRDRKGTRLNSSHLGISYAVFCLKKKKYALRSGRLCLWQAVQRVVRARAVAALIRAASGCASGKGVVARRGGEAVAGT